MTHNDAGQNSRPGNPDHIRYNKAIQTADRAHSERKADAEKQYADDVNEAKAALDRAVEALPKGGVGVNLRYTEASNQASAAFNKAMADAEEKRKRTIQKSQEKHDRDRASAREVWRTSENFAGHF